MSFTFKSLVRRKRFWLVALFVVYSLFGFLVAPWIIKDQTLKAIDTNLGRAAHIETVRFNPWIFTLAVRGFALPDPDGTAFVTFDEFYGNFQLSSLFRWAFTFKELRLDNPAVHVRVLADSSLNFQDMVDHLEASAADKPSAVAEETPAIPRLLFGLIQINGARLKATNLTAAVPQEVAFTPTDLEIADLSTLADHDGAYTLSATDFTGGRWSWSGTLLLNPVHATGRFELEGTDLKAAWDVVRAQFPFEVTEGRLGLQLEYEVAVHGDSVQAAVQDASLALDGLRFREKDSPPDLFTLDSLRVSGVTLQYPQQTVAVQRVELAGSRVTAWLDENGVINWQTLMASLATDTTTVHRPAASVVQERDVSTWDVTLAELDVVDAGLHFEDQTLETVFAVDVGPVGLQVRDVALRPEHRFGTQLDVALGDEGRMRIEGQVGMQPLVANLHVALEKLPMTLVQPYVQEQARLELVSGTVGLQGDVQVGLPDSATVPTVSFTGSFLSEDFLSRDTIENERFVSWGRLAAQGIHVADNQVEIDSIVAEKPYARVVVHQDRTTNLQDVLMMAPDSLGADSLTTVASETTAGTAGAAPTEDVASADSLATASAPPTVPVRIDVIRVVEGSADFADFSLILPFAAGIQSLDGEIRGLAPEVTSRADVELDGLAQPDGVAQVRGQINVLSDTLFTDINLAFRDFNMTTLTPYSGQYIGREIDSGTLELDLTYQVQGMHLIGDNKVVVDGLKLGDSVDSPDATSLPVGVAVSLLKDDKGVINLDVPVEGDLDDPGFNVTDTITDVLVNTVTKVVSSPFKLLGNLVSIGGEEAENLGFFDFQPGQAMLPPEAESKLPKLAEALEKRQELRLEVQGTSNEQLDARGLRAVRFAAVADEEVAKWPRKYAAPQGQRWSPKLLIDLYDASFGKDAHRELEERFRVPARDAQGNALSGETELEVEGYHEALYDRLLDQQPFEPSELQALAEERARSLHEALLAAGVAPERLILIPTPAPGEVHQGRVRLPLTLAE